MVVNGAILITITLLIQFGTRNTTIVGLVLVGMCVFAAVTIYFFVPESPQWFHNKGDLEDF